MARIGASGMSVSGTDYREKLRCGVFGVDLIYYVGDDVVGVGYESSAHSAHIFTAGHLLFLPYAEGLVHLGAGVGEENEVEVMFFPEFEVACRSVLADSDDGISQC